MSRHAKRFTCALACALLPGAAFPLSLEFPANSTPVAEVQSAGDSVFLPTSAYDDGVIDGVTAEGALRKQSWRVGSGSLTTLQMIAPLRDQLSGAGYDILYECEAEACGGFDFRYKLETFPEPEMHVALGDFRYLAARRVDEGAEDFASVIVSRSGNAGFVQLTLVGASAAPPVKVTTATKAPAREALPRGEIGQLLETQGHAPLNDLVFKRGSSQLGDGSFSSLDELASYLLAAPDRQVTLVGHTDSEGSLDGNVALSKRRANSVRAELVDRYGVPSRQVSSDGVGYLSPIASNVTAEGRAQNRRVEVILTSTE